MTGAAGAGGLQLLQRYELAAALCKGLRVLDLSDAPAAARAALESSAAEVATKGGQGEVDAVLALDGLADGERRARILAELERLSASGVRVVAAFGRAISRASAPRVDPPAEDAAAAFARKLGGAVTLPQYVVEGSLIGSPNGDVRADIQMRGADVRPEDASVLIVASGFAEDALAQAHAALRLEAGPVLHSYVYALETAHAELLRANRELMREGLGREGSAAASLLNAQRELEEMRGIARGHEEQVRRVEAWYDAPRYHLVDRVRETVTRIPGLPGMIRFLWSLISTRAESAQLDAAANPEPDDSQETAEVTRAREGLSADDEEAAEPAEVTQRLEE